MLGVRSWLKRFSSKNFKEKNACHKRLTLRAYRHTSANACVGCGLCVDMCPVDALDVQSSCKVDGSVDVESFTLDAQACIQCGLCVDVCPINALHFENSKKSLEPRTYTKQELEESSDA